MDTMDSGACWVFGHGRSTGQEMDPTGGGNATQGYKDPHRVMGAHDPLADELLDRALSVLLGNVNNWTLGR